MKFHCRDETRMPCSGFRRRHRTPVSAAWKSGSGSGRAEALTRTRLENIGQLIIRGERQRSKPAACTGAPILRMRRRSRPDAPRRQYAPSGEGALRVRAPEIPKPLPSHQAQSCARGWQYSPPSDDIRLRGPDTLMLSSFGSPFGNQNSQIRQSFRNSPAEPGETRTLVRSRGLEPPRCYPLAPQASASTNSAMTA